SWAATARRLSGSSRWAKRYIASRQLQNESCECSWRSAMPAIARWNACECRLAMPGTTRWLMLPPLRACSIRPWRSSWNLVPWCQPSGCQILAWGIVVMGRILARRAGSGEHAPPTMAGHVNGQRPWSFRMTDTRAQVQRWDGLVLGASIATLDEDGYGAIDDGALAWRGDTLAWVGARADLPGAPAELAREVIEASGWVTPGLVDCHTHLVFAGDRAREFEMRLQGASYEEIARSGGGIVSSVRAVREAGEDDLFAQSIARARALVADGATTLEIKSGYGLDLENEHKMLRVARRIGTELGITVRTTYLAAHALPPE